MIDAPLAQLAETYARDVRLASTSGVSAEPEAQLTVPVSEFLRAFSSVTGLGDLSLLREAQLDGVRPDFAALIDGRPCGWVELKAPGHTVIGEKWRGREKGQWDLLSQLDALLVSNGDEIALYVSGSLVDTAFLPVDGVAGWDADRLRTVLEQFTLAQPRPITRVSQLADRLAPLARFLRERLQEGLSNNYRSVREAKAAWDHTVHHTTTDAQFAGDVAQVVAYSMAIAGLSGQADRNADGVVTLEEAKHALETAHRNVLAASLGPIIGIPALMEYIAPEVGAIMRLVSSMDVAAIERRKSVLPQIYDLHALYQALEAARQKRGAIEFETPETKMLCDEQGRITEIVAQSRNDAHKLIEECMLAANTCAADFLESNKHPALYRVHEGPSPDRLAKLREFLAGTGLRLGNAQVEAREKRGPRPQDYQVLSQQIQGRPDAALLQTMMLRSMQAAVYTPDNQGHFGLAYDAYAHFTSPIRRYPDLLNHRAIKALLENRRYLPVIEADAGKPNDEVFETEGAQAKVAALAIEGEAAAGRPTTRSTRSRSQTSRRQKAAQAQAASHAVWERLGTLCSANERRADEASRDVQAWLKCVYMRDRIGDRYQGHITGVAPFGVFVTLDDLYVEGMVHVSELGSEYFRYDEAGQVLIGERTGRRYALTDEVEVQVMAVNLEARRIDFRLVEDTGRTNTRAEGRGRRSEDSGGRRDADTRPSAGRRRSKAPTQALLTAPAKVAAKGVAGVEEKAVSRSSAGSRAGRGAARTPAAAVRRRRSSKAGS